MPMWFTHLDIGMATLSALGAPVDPDAFAWGLICPDVDKVSHVPRKVSHLGGRDLALHPARFLAAAGLPRDKALSHRAFLAGYVSHLAVDDAWYEHIWHARAQVPALADGRDLTGWTGDSSRALNLAWDQRIRRASPPPPLDLARCQGEDILPFLAGPPARALRDVLRAYLGWSGALDEPSTDPRIQAWRDSFRTLVAGEGRRVSRMLDVLDPATVRADLLDRSLRAAGDLLQDLA